MTPAGAPDKGVGTGDLFCASLEWHKGPAENGEGTAGKDEETGAPLFYNGDRLLLIIETNKGREIAVVDIDCDEDYFRVTAASSGDDFDAWGPEAWSWWAKLDKRNTPPALSQNNDSQTGSPISNPAKPST